MKSGNNGKKAGAGRKHGSKNKKPTGIRFTPTVRRETLEWINNQPLSQGKVIDGLVGRAISVKQGE